jgi:hypothetical protein
MGGEYKRGREGDISRVKLTMREINRWYMKEIKIGEIV